MFFLNKISYIKNRDANAKFVDLISMLNKLLHGIKIYNNVFSDKERAKLFSNLGPYLTFWTDNHPGLQTDSSMHKLVDIPYIKYFTYDHCWMNYTDVNFPDREFWHTHPCKRAGVYYFSDCPGTVFQGKFGKFQLEGNSNSIITFPGTLRHTAPVNKSGARYTMAFEILEEWSSGLWHWS